MLYLTVEKMKETIKEVQKEIESLKVSVVLMESRTWTQRKSLHEMTDELKEQIRFLQRDVINLKFRLDKRRRVAKKKRTSTKSSSTSRSSPKAQSSGITNRRKPC